MKISTVTLKNFRGFHERIAIRFGALSTIVGRNDAGKSTVLHALEIFFNGSPDLDDFSRHAKPDEPIEITVTFCELPNVIQLEDGVDTSLQEEHLLDADGELAIRKTYPRKNPKKPTTTLLVCDYADGPFGNLCSQIESGLNKLGDQYNLGFTKSGAGITNKGKRAALRQQANDLGIPKEPAEIEPSDPLEKCILAILPAFDLFRTDWRLSEEETPFQRRFKDMAAQRLESESAREDIEAIVQQFLDEEIATILPFLLQHTDEVQSLAARPDFKWKELVSFQIETKGKEGMEVPLGKRGAGLRRLFMVAYFQYLAQKPGKGQAGPNRVYAIEEPETYLHPSAQRVLLDSLLLLSSHSQILLTSHSPVFAGSTARDQLILVSKVGAEAQVTQGDQLSLDDVAAELGVEATDSLYDYKACVFVEGPDDVTFLETVASKLKACGAVAYTFEDKGIGLIPLGGKHNLKWWVNRGVLKKTSRNYGVFVDSDRCGPNDTPCERLVKWQQCCTSDGGKFHITRKREIENYLHPDVINQYLKKADPFDDFTDMKTCFGQDLVNLISCMSAQQILERDRYMENGEEKHELVDVIENFMTLA